MSKSYPLGIKRASDGCLKKRTLWLLCAVYPQLNRVAEEKAGTGVEVVGVRE